MRSSITFLNRSAAMTGGTWPRIGEKSQQLLKRITWVVSISRGVPPSLHRIYAVLRRVAAPPRNKTQRKTNSELENVWENNERGTPLKWTRRRTSQRASYPSPPYPSAFGKAGPNLGDEWSGDSRGPLWHDFETIASLKAAWMVLKKLTRHVAAT